MSTTEGTSAASAPGSGADLGSLQHEIEGLTGQVKVRLEQEWDRATRVVGVIALIAAQLVVGLLRFSVRVGSAPAIGTVSPLPLVVNLLLSAILAAIGVVLLVAPRRSRELVRRLRSRTVESSSQESGQGSTSVADSMRELSLASRAVTEVSRLSTVFVILVALSAAWLGGLVGGALAEALLTATNAFQLSLAAGAAFEIAFAGVLILTLVLGDRRLRTVWRLASRLEQMRGALGHLEGEVWQRY